MLITAAPLARSFKEVADENVCLLALLSPVILKSRILLVTGVHCLPSHQQLSECLNVSAPATKIPEQTNNLAQLKERQKPTLFISRQFISMNLLISPF